MKHILFLLALLVSVPAFAQDQQPKVHARLVAEQSAVAPGGSVTVALEEVIKRWPKWEVDYAGATKAHTSSVRGWSSLPVFTAEPR